MGRKSKRLATAAMVLFVSLLALFAQESASAAEWSAREYCWDIYWCGEDCDAELCDQYVDCDGACEPGLCGASNPEGPEYNYCFPDIE